MTEALIILALVAVYFLPTIVASRRRHHQGPAILVLNLFLGWTFIGWVVALVWAATEVRERAWLVRSWEGPAPAARPFRVQMAPERREDL